MPAWTLQFISDNINLFYIVRGNHEVAVSLFIFLLSHFLFLFHCTFPFIALKFFFFSFVFLLLNLFDCTKIYQHLKGEKTVRKEMLQYFTSAPFLETNEKARELFLALYEKARPFYRCLPSGKGPSFIVTHAPCLNKYPF